MKIAIIGAELTLATTVTALMQKHGADIIVVETKQPELQPSMLLDRAIPFELHAHEPMREYIAPDAHNYVKGVTYNKRKKRRL